MNTSPAAVALVLLVAVVAANAPFFTERLLLVGPRRLPRKALGWRLLEMVVLYGVTIGIGFAVEARQGQRQPQGWEFYAASACLFVTLAFPGFVWRYLRRQQQ